VATTTTASLATTAAATPTTTLLGRVKKILKLLDRIIKPLLIAEAGVFLIRFQTVNLRACGGFGGIQCSFVLGTLIRRIRVPRLLKIFKLRHLYSYVIIFEKWTGLILNERQHG
jgi:hypothetical protein